MKCSISILAQFQKLENFSGTLTFLISQNGEMHLFKLRMIKPAAFIYHFFSMRSSQILFI